MSSLRFFPKTDTSLNTKSIPNPHSEFGVHDTLRFGLNSVSKELAPNHPLESVLSQDYDLSFQRKLTMQRNIFGLHAPLRLQMEKALISLKPMSPVLPSHNLAQSILDGTDETIDVEDFLGAPDQHTQMLDFHAIMERRFDH